MTTHRLKIQEQYAGAVLNGTKMYECCCDYGICEFEFEEAFDEEAGKRPLPAWEAACWARDWIVEHYKDMQEAACDMFCG